jgi:hypothetical protein
MSLFNLIATEDIFENYSFYHVHLLLYSVNRHFHEVCFRSRVRKARCDMLFIEREVRRYYDNGTEYFTNTGCKARPGSRKIKECSPPACPSRVHSVLEDHVCRTLYVATLPSHWSNVKCIRHRIRVDFEDTAVVTLSLLLRRGYMPLCEEIVIDGAMRYDTMRLMQSTCNSLFLRLSFYEDDVPCLQNIFS